MQDIAEALCIQPFMLPRWRKQAREAQILTKSVEVDKEIVAELKALRRMKKDYERLKIEQFTHCCSKARKGWFKILRLTVNKRMQATLAAIRETLQGVSEIWLPCNAR